MNAHSIRIGDFADDSDAEPLPSVAELLQRAQEESRLGVITDLPLVRAAHLRAAAQWMLLAKECERFSCKH